MDLGLYVLVGLLALVFFTMLSRFVVRRREIAKILNAEKRVERELREERSKPKLVVNVVPSEEYLEVSVDEALLSDTKSSTIVDVLPEVKVIKKSKKVPAKKSSKNKNKKK